MTSGVGDLTRVAQDYLKAIWSATEWGDPPITTSALAARFQTSAPNVSDTLRRLAGQGLIAYRPYRPVRLTPEGERLALAMVRRHRLIEAFLAETLGYGWDEVHEEAERLEHAVSDDFIERVDSLLGRPRADPHGDPIPPGRRLDADLLSESGPGRKLVVRVSDADPAVLHRLEAAGVRPGAVVEASEVDADPADLAEVRVVPAPGDQARSDFRVLPGDHDLVHDHQDGGGDGHRDQGAEKA